MQTRNHTYASWKAARRGRPVLELLLVLLVLLFLGTSGAQAQQAEPDTATTREVFIERADLLEGFVEGDERMRRLVGNVRLRQDSTYLYANRALQYLDGEEILFFGDVVVLEESDTLWADTVRYDRLRKIGRARGRVRLSDGEVRVLAPTGTYFVDEKRTRFEDGVTLFDSLTTLVSRRGTYRSRERRADFAGDVRLYEPRSYLEADSITYYRDTDVSEAYGNVQIQRLGRDEQNEDAPPDSAVRTVIFGDQAYNDEPAGYSRVNGRSLLVQLRRDATSVDTLVIQSQRLEAVQQDSLQRLTAIDSVRVWRHDFSAVADSMVYDRVELGADTLEEVRLFQSPMMWHQASQMSGDTIRVTVQGGDLDSLFVRHNTFVAQLDSVTQRIQQLKGRHLVGVSTSDTTRQFVVRPNAEAILHRANEQNQPDGAVQASGDRSTFAFVHDELRRIDVTGDPEGTYYAENQLPSPFQLDGFVWRPERRPAKAALLEPVGILPPFQPYTGPELPALFENLQPGQERPALDRPAPLPSPQPPDTTRQEPDPP